MAGSSNFVVFNPTLANSDNDATYAAETAVLNGLQDGLAKTALFNKAFHQWSIMTAAIGNFIANSGGVASDIDVAALTTAFSNALSSLPQLGVNNQSIILDLAIIQSFDTRSVTFTYTSGQLTQVVLKDGATTVKTTNLTYTSGQLTQIQSLWGSHTRTVTFTYTSGVLTGITKAVT